jgi:hypothetical protein
MCLPQDPITSVNDILIGPAGSGTLLHLDFPPVRSFLLVVSGKKRVCWWNGNPSKLPGWVRVHRVGAPSYSLEEYTRLAEWCTANGGLSVVLEEGKSMAPW